MNLGGFAASFALDHPVSSAIIIIGALLLLLLKGLEGAKRKRRPLQNS
jgi:hypothetical protein